MQVAPNKSALKKRLDRYFWENDSKAMEVLQNELRSHFYDFKRVAVMGGLVRDFARGGRLAFKSDVDLVIEGPKNSVETLALMLGATSNRYGGYGYMHKGWKIDFWALETTWARKHIPIYELEDLLLSTFFDWDAAVYDLVNKKLICDDHYLEGIKNRKLDINLMENPSLDSNFIRAIRRLKLWGVSSGPTLKQFIDNYLTSQSLIKVKKKEKESYHYQVSALWNSVEDAKKDLFQDVCSRKNEQLALF